MGYVSEQRTAKILEDVLLDWLHDGVIPTTEQLQEAYNSAVAVHGNLSRSSLRQVDLPARWSESSAAQYNLVLDALDGDISVLLRSLVDISNLSITTLTEWNSRAKSLNIRLANLKARIESLLLLKSDTAGYLSFVEDGFLSLENISSDTTANIDTRTGEVTLNVDRTSGTGEFQGTQIDLRSAEVTWGLIEGGNIRFSASTAGSSLSNLLSDRTSRWGVEANTIRPDKFRTSNKESKPVTGELKIKLPRETEVSKIILVASDASAGDTSVIAAQYSIDGYTWETVPSESSVLSGTSNFSWRFEKTKMKWIKLIISKSSPDIPQTVTSVYDFGFERIKVYSEEFTISTNGDLVVSELMTPQLGGADVLFGRASLEVCEEVPSDTSLRYYLRAYDGSSYTNWVQVSPISRSQSSTPAVVDFSAPIDSTSESITTTFNSGINTEALNIMRVDGSGDFSYRFNGPNDTVANFYLPQNNNLITNLTLLRNIGYESAKYPTATSGDLKVGDIEVGWGLDNDSIYYCVFLVKNPAGLSLDFGHTQAVLDGSLVSGIVTISAGWHTFRTDRANWGAIYGLSAPSTVSELKSIDPLYPYNHKYIIEGYTYPSTWTGETVYLGTDAYGQYLSTRTGRHEFINSDLDLSIYALDVISGPKTFVLLKFDSSRPSHENERVRLFYTNRVESYSGIQFKAILKSENAGRTPILSYYRVRVK